MLTREENELLTRTGPGTPLGELFRRYWLPALQSDEIAEPDGAPVQVQILSERLVAFRDTEGKVGLLEEACTHRGASLWYARNEECGLRCIYHGWKYDVNGNCLAMPAEPADSSFKHKVRHPAYPVRELGGIIWAYLGPREKMPPFPAFQWTELPESQRMVAKVLQECNYLQGLEGGIDSAHLGFLHRSFERSDGPWGLHLADPATSDNAPRLEVQYTAYGYRYGAVRRASGANQYIRITPFVMPCYTYVPPDASGDILFHAWVPRDDYSNWAWDVHYNMQAPIDVQRHVERRGLWLDASFRKLRNVDNKHLQDREAMKARSFSGIYGIMNQDQAVQESMGPIYDRSKEHLGTSDKAVIAMRRFLLDSLRAFADGQDPAGLDAAIPFDRICSEAVVMPGHLPWQEACPLAPELSARPAASAR
jgi:phthalate 4,5-dioxygenase oxygenase subunit